LLQARLGSFVRVTQSTPELLEVIPADVSKAHAAMVLIGDLGLGQNQVVAVGDSDNDVELLEWAGLGIAVSGATSAARAAADCVLSWPAGAGAAEEIERIVLDAELIDGHSRSPPASSSG
jgi:hydroxymethylpyrimidine pyrophosphatase-like HAD family hydrolase